MTLLPLLFVVVQAHEATWTHIWLLLDRPRVGVLLINTLEMVILSTAASVVIAVGAAWCVERTTLPGYRLWSAAVPLPLAIPAVVSAYGWITYAPHLQGLWGAVVVDTFAYYPLIYLPVAAAFRTQDPALEEVARSLKMGPWRTFWRVCLPPVIPALSGGVIVVALHLLAEYGAFALVRFQTFTTAIYDEYRLSFDGPSAAALTLVLLALCLGVLILDVALRGRTLHTRTGGGAQRRTTRLELGKWTVPTLAALSLLLLLTLGVPLGMLGYWLIQPHRALFSSISPLAATGTTLTLGLAAAIVTTLLALPIAVLASRYRGWVVTVVERSAYIGQALPGLTIALALIFFSVRYLYPLYQTSGLLIVAYAILALPLALVAQRGALARADRRLEEMARALGQKPLGVLRRVTLPLMLPGLGAGAALVFAATATELTTTLLLRPTGLETLATAFWSNATDLSYPDAAPYALLMIVAAAPATFAFTIWGRAR